MVLPVRSQASALAAARSHSRTPSDPAEASSRPFELKLVLHTVFPGPSWPYRVRHSLPLATSHKQPPIAALPWLSPPNSPEAVTSCRAARGSQSRVLPSQLRETS